MAPDAGADQFVGLADVDRLIVVVEEGIDAPAEIADRLPGVDEPGSDVPPMCPPSPVAGRSSKITINTW